MPPSGFDPLMYCMVLWRWHIQIRTTRIFVTTHPLAAGVMMKKQKWYFGLTGWHIHPLPYSLNVVKGQGCLGVGCLSLRTFYLRAGITSDVSATPHLHGGPVHIFSTRRVDFDDSFCLSLSSFTVVCSPSLLPVLAACFFSLSSSPIRFPCPHRCPSSSFRLFLSLSCLVLFATNAWGKVFRAFGLG